MSVLTGLLLSTGILALMADVPTWERLRRTLRALLVSLDHTIRALDDRNRPDAAGLYAEAHQRLRAGMLTLVEIARFAGAGRPSGRDETSAARLVDAIETLLIRYAALEQARARWTQECGPEGERRCPRTQFGQGWRDAFDTTLRDLIRYLDDRRSPLGCDALDAQRDRAWSELEQIRMSRADAAPTPGMVYVLGIAGHYAGVSRALRELVEAVRPIAWDGQRIAIRRGSGAPC
jgi:hypothetical protein